MTDARINIAADINRHHRLACLRADEAIGHALQAGKLLLQVKSSLPHGQWLGWLAANVGVTARQAQRYMQAAQGKPLPIRAIPSLHSDISEKPAAKSDTTSHLPDWTPRPAFIPIAGHWCWCADEGDSMAYVVEPSAAHSGYFFISHLHDEGDTYDCTRRPVRADWVEENLKHLGLTNPAGAAWHICRSAGVNRPLDTINASGGAS